MTQRVLGAQQGMTLRDYFAAHAPADPPHWWADDACNPADPPPTEPASWKTLGPTHAEEARQWLADGTWDLPEELRWWQEAWDVFREAETGWHDRQTAWRFYTWRFVYADAMLRARGDA